MDWNTAIKGFQIYLKLERYLSSNSIEAYLDDIQKLSQQINNECIWEDGYNDPTKWGS